MRIVVAGTGYVGLVTAVCLSEKGHHVICVDIDEHKIALMQQGISPIFENGLEEMMLRNRERLIFTTDYRSAYRDADAIIICVGTPEKKDGSVNLAYVLNVAKEIARMAENDCVIVLKSTAPIGTSDKIEIFVQENLKHNVHIEVVANPEFLSQGTAVKDTLGASRIILGVESDFAERVMRTLYADFHLPIIVTDRRSAEMIKYASNDFLALKISYINEIANLCESIGANIEDVALGMGLDPRIGSRFLQAGVGYGGSCFPKDTKALHWLSNYYDIELKTVKAAIEVNEKQKQKLIIKSRKYYASFEGLTVAVLGLSFKPNTDDLRDAPSLDNIPVFLEDGAIVRAYDPVGEKNYRKLHPLQIQYCRTIEETLKDADICFIFTEWDEIKNFDIAKFGALMRNPIVLDGRNCYTIKDMEEMNVVYESIGRKTVGKKMPESARCM